LACPSDKALAEFLSEAQEIVDGFNHHLLLIDEQRSAGEIDLDPELVNELFRGVHSLKGLAGMFGLQQMAEVAHTLENVLDSLRLGRVPASPEILDVLFESVELFGAMIDASAKGKHVAKARMVDFMRRLNVAANQDGAGISEQDALSMYQFPPSILSVLTEYEEHRLVENIKQLRPIYRLRAAFDLMTIDTALERLKERLKAISEVITYLPSADSIDDTTIQLDVIVGVKVGPKEFLEALKDEEIEIEQVRRTDESRPQPVPEPEPAAAAPEPVAAPAVEEIAVAPEPATAEQVEAAPEPAHAPAPAPVHKPAPTVAEPAPAEELGTIRSVSQTVRVDIHKLDGLMNTVSELSIAHAGIAGVLEQLAPRLDLVDQVRTLTREVRLLERRLAELQGGILEVRMVPLRQVFDKLSRVVRKVSRESGKEIRLEITGADTELDKLIVEELSDPLMHIIRNAIDHGIETPAERKAAGKPSVGTIHVGARQEGSRVVVSVSDDGRGIDIQRVAEAASSRGVIDAAAAADMNQRELLNLLFLPGMSTRDSATELSGRGVGLDVVKTNIARLSGIIDLTSEVGAGAEFSITLPITLAIMQALVIRAAGRVYAVPLNSVLESLVIESHEIQTVEGREVHSLRDHTLVLSRLERLFRLERAADQPAPDKQYCVVIGLAQHRLGLLVDELIGERDIVIKPLGKTLADVPGIAGATELSHQETVLVLDVPGLVEETLLRTGGTAEAA
jgi:two-component system chemotaxis sensor kinase CheA